MKNKRIKLPIHDPAAIDIEATIEAIALCTNAERIIVTRMDAALEAVRAQYTPQLTNAQTTLADLTARARAWAEAHPEQFAKRKTLSLAHGKLGFRTGTPKLTYLRGWTVKRIIAKLLDSPFWTTYIRHAPEINKERIIQDFPPRLSDSAVQLASVGMKVVQHETFFVEPNLTELPTRQTAPSSPVPTT